MESGYIFVHNLCFLAEWSRVCGAVKVAGTCASFQPSHRRRSSSVYHQRDTTSAYIGYVIFHRILGLQYLFTPNVNVARNDRKYLLGRHGCCIPLF